MMIAGKKSGYKGGRKAVSDMDQAQNLLIKSLEKNTKDLLNENRALRQCQEDLRRRMEMLEYKFGLDR